jgi:hypothetical protein
MQQGLARLVLGSVVLLAGCGVKFAEAPVNTTLPEVFKQRLLYPGGVASYDSQDLVGNVLQLAEGQEALRVAVIRPDAYTPQLITIVDPNNYYRSRIQRGAEEQGSYLAFAESLKADQMAELILTDVARAGIVLDNAAQWEQIVAKSAQWVASHPKASPGVQRLWVKAVVLTRRSYSDFSKISANASGQVGSVVGVKGGVYRNSEQEQKSVNIAFEAFDIDKLVAVARPVSGATAGQPVLPYDSGMAKKLSLAGTIKGTLRSTIQ